MQLLGFLGLAIVGYHATHVYGRLICAWVEMSVLFVRDDIRHTASRFPKGNRYEVLRAQVLRGLAFDQPLRRGKAFSDYSQKRNRSTTARLTSP